MFLLVEKMRDFPAFGPVRLSAENGHDAYEEAARRFENAVGYESAYLYEEDVEGFLTLRGRFTRERFDSATVVEGEVLSA